MNVRVVFGSHANRIWMAACVVVLVALAAAPFWGGRDDLALLSEMYAYVALASLWNLLAGYAGLVSVGQQAYVGLAPMCCSLAPSLPASRRCSPFARRNYLSRRRDPVAALVFRLRGHYFAIGHGLSPRCFAFWLHRLRRSAAARAPAFLPP